MNQSVYRVITATLSLVFVLCSITVAAGSGFQIPDYIPTHFSDLEWRLNGDLNWSSQNNNNIYFGNQTSDRQRQSLRSSTDLDYRFYTPDKFYNAGGYFSVLLSRTRSNSESTIIPDLQNTRATEANSTRKDINIDINPEFEAGSYFSSDYFVSGEVDIKFDYNHLFPSKSKSRYFRRTSDSDRENIETRYDYRESERTSTRTIGALELSVGRGRVYEGKFASTAMYMVEELQNQGLLIRELNKEEMLTLTESVYQLRQKHQVDRRIFKIEALKEILDYLIVLGAMDQESVLSYLTIQDVWDFFPHKKNRKFGYNAKLGFGLVEEYQHYEDKANRTYEAIRSTNYFDTSRVDWIDSNFVRDEIKTSRTDKNHNGYIFCDLSYYKPLSRRLQLNCESRWNFFLNDGGAYVPLADSRYARMRRGYLYPNLLDLHDYANGSTRFELHYIYNSRTELDLSTLILYETYTFNEARSGEVVDPASRELLSFELSSALTYRISIPTELKVRLSYLSSEGGRSTIYSNDASQQDFTLTGSINHYLF